MRIPLEEYSKAAFWVSPTTPCLAATHPPKDVNPTAPKIEAVLTIMSLPCF